MNIINGTITIIALILACVYGGMEVARVETGITITPWRMAIHLDPTFVVWTDKDIPGSAFSLGPVIVMQEQHRGTQRGRYLLHHEMIHVKQWYALGWLMWPAYWFDVLAIESWHKPDWNRPEQNDEHMWVPDGRSSWGHFVTIEVRLGN